MYRNKRNLLAHDCTKFWGTLFCVVYNFPELPNCIHLKKHFPILPLWVMRRIFGFLVNSFSTILQGGHKCCGVSTYAYSARWNGLSWPDRSSTWSSSAGDPQLSHATCSSELVDSKGEIHSKKLTYCISNQQHFNAICYHTVRYFTP